MPDTKKPVPPALNFLVFAGLALAILASAMLVLMHFAAMSLPGCGPGSACASLTSGPWGRVPGIGLPVSFIGLAYFVAMTVEYARGLSRGAPRGLIWIIRVGAIASIGFTGVMLAQKHFCPYCGLAHLGNLLFWIAAEFASGRGGETRRAPVTLLVGVIVGCGVLFAADAMRGRQMQTQGEEQLEDDIDKIRTGDGDETAFTGRWRIGPEIAPIRIVISSDYQCPDCKKIEAQTRQILETYGDRVSLSAKHFPMSEKCNKFVKGGDPHPNACWAARAAETAGILHGNDGFWRMHHWLFDRGGAFTDAELKEGLTSLGWNIPEFLEVMQGAETLAQVEADIEETYALGLYYTPMVFVNGVEMKGIWIKDGLIKTVADVAATNPEAKSADGDQPPPALQRYVDDWKEQFARPLQGLDDAPLLGPPDAPVDVIVWGDLQEPNTGKLHRALRDAVAQRGNVRYRFLQYPVNQACNPVAKVTKHPNACLAAKMAVASGRLGGNDAYWRMQDWLVENRANVSPENVVTAAAHADVDAAALLGLMDTAEVTQTIEREARAGQTQGIRAIPYVFVNRKLLPRWQRPGVDVLSSVLDEAAGE